MNEQQIKTESIESVLASFSIPQLEDRLYQLHGEEAAIRTLLRSLKARQRSRRVPNSWEARDAS
jgi:hypothetical protein